jgi:hypothetical protein
VIVSSGHRRVAGLLPSRPQSALSDMLKSSPHGIHLGPFISMKRRSVQGSHISIRHRSSPAMARRKSN